MTNVKWSDFDAVAYDFDGTIADTRDIHTQARLEAFEQYGNEHNDERYANIPERIHAEAHFHGHHSIEIIAWVLYKAGITTEIDLKAAKPVRDLKTDIYYDKATQGLPPMPGALDFIYRGGILWPGMQGIVTSAYREREVTPFIDKYSLRQDFSHDHIVTADDFLTNSGDIDLLKQKPAPDQYNLIIERFDIEPARLLVFEDNSRGMKAAKAAGAFVIGVATTHTPQEIKTFETDALPDVIAEGFNHANELLKAA